MTWFLDILMWFHFGDDWGPGFIQILIMACVIFGLFFIARSVGRWMNHKE